MSWKKYGGTNKLDKINNISVNTLVTDKFTLKNYYVGDWDICGGLIVKDNTYLSQNLNVQGNIFTRGNIDISGAMNVYNTNIIGDVFVANSAYVRENIFMDICGNTVLHGENRKFGFNTTIPQATIDICGDLVRTIDIHTSTTTNKNVIARNVFNQGMTVNVEPTRSYIDFYVDNSMNLSTENYNGRLVYEQGGNFTIDVSNTVKFKPRVIFSNDLSKNLIADERLIIYANPSADVPYIPSIYNNNDYKTGTAAFMVAGDNSSNVFFRMGTEKVGMTMGGGYFPDNKIMGTIALIDASSVKYPAMNIISGNLITNLKTSIGVNKYNVTTANNTNKYAMDINGPVKLGYQELIVAKDISFQVFSVDFSGNVGFALGSPSSITTSYIPPLYTQYFLKTIDGGYTWTYNRLIDLFGNTNPNSVESSPHYFYSVYMLSETDILIAGDNRYFYRSVNGGTNWSQILYDTNNTINATSLFLSNPGIRLIIGTDSGIIFNSTTWQTNLNINNKIGFLPISTGLTRVNAIHGNFLDTVIVGIGGIVPYRTYNGILGGTIGTLINTGSSMYGVNVLYDNSYNHVVAVGDGKIYYTHNLQWSSPSYNVSWNSITITGTLRSIKILDYYRAIAVGDSGLIMYSIDGFATWQTVTQAMIDTMGNGSLLSGVNLSNINILNANDFVVSGTIHVYNSTVGRTKMFNLYSPYFLNRPNNHVLEASGNIVVSGDLQINDAGQILTNTANFNILPNVASEINIGNTLVGGNTNVKANLDVTLNMTGHQTLTLYGDASLNSNLFVSGRTKIVDLSAQNVDLTGNLRINTIDSMSGSTMTIGGSTTTLNIGNTTSNVTIYGNLFLPGSITTTTVINLEIKNKVILLNDQSTESGNTMFSGLQFRDNSLDNCGYFLINGLMDGFIFKSTQSTNRVNLDISGLHFPSGSQGFVLLKPTSSLDISADYTITTGLVGIGDIQELDASLNNKVERDVNATTQTTQVITTNILAGGLYVNKAVDSYITNSQMDISGNAFISKLGLGTSGVNTQYTLDVSGSVKILKNIDMSGSLSVQTDIISFGKIVQW